MTHEGDVDGGCTQLCFSGGIRLEGRRKHDRKYENGVGGFFCSRRCDAGSVCQVRDTVATPRRGADEMPAAAVRRELLISVVGKRVFFAREAVKQTAAMPEVLGDVTVVEVWC